jgi:hypothetical protein
MKRRWWVLALGVVLLLFGLLSSGPVDGVRGTLGALGFVMVYMAMLAVLRGTTMALRARSEAHRASSSH